MMVGAQLAQRLKELGREEQDEQPVGQCQRAAVGPEMKIAEKRHAQVHGHQRDGEGGEELQDRGGEKATRRTLMVRRR